MAKNTGILKFQGTIEELTYYRTQDGDIVRKKGGVEKSRILTDPSFARTRENMSEFAHAAQSGKMLRRALNPLMQNAKDNRVTSRLAQAMHNILKQDAVSLRGARTVTQGLATAPGKALLQGFNFNKNAPLEAVLKARYLVDTTLMGLIIEDFTPALHLAYPSSATHVSMQLGEASVDFATGQFEYLASNAVVLPIDMTAAELNLGPIGAPPVLPGSLFMCVLVEFSQEVNGAQYPLGAGFNSLGIVHVGIVL